MQQDASLDNIKRHPSVAKDLKRLRGFRTTQASLESFERLLADEAPNMGRLFPGFGDRRIFKGDMHLHGYGRQARGACRVVYEHQDDKYEILYVYAKNDDVPEHEVIKEVNSRLSSHS